MVDHTPRNRLAGLAGLAVSIVIVAGLAAGPAGASAMASAASSSMALTAPPYASFNAVSCPRRTWCMAVGVYISAGVRHALAQEWSKGTWHLMKPSGGEMISVSCVSASFCMAGRNPASADTWNGRSWRKTPFTSLVLRDVSCASTKLCMTTQGSEVWTWFGRKWRAQPGSDMCSVGPPGPCSLEDVSCGMTSNCVTVGSFNASQEVDQVDSGAFFWNGRTWTFNSPPSLSDNSVMRSVSCLGGFCMSVGTAYGTPSLTMAAIWNARNQAWRNVSPTPGSKFYLDQVSCGTTTSCMAIDDSGNSLWNGHRWLTRNSVSAGHGSLMEDVACRGLNCMGVGFRKIKHVTQPLAELWNGRRWRILPVPTRGL